MHLLSIVIVVIIVIAGLIWLGKAGHEARKSPVLPTPPARPQSSTCDRLSDEPHVAEYGELCLELKLTIDPAREADLKVLRGCGAVEEGSFSDSRPVLRFRDIPVAQLHRLFPGIADTEEYNVSLHDPESSQSLRFFTGPWPQIRAELLAFAETPAGFRLVTQERGDLADGRYFTRNMYFQIDRHHQDMHLRVCAISRDRLRAQIGAQVVWVDERLSGTAVS